MSDSLIVCSEAGDTLCVDIVKPDQNRLAIYFKSVDELSELITQAYREERIDSDDCRLVLNDGLALLIEHEARRRERTAVPRRCTDTEWIPPAGGYYVSEAWKTLSGLLLVTVAVLVAVGFWVVGRGR